MNQILFYKKFNKKISYIFKVQLIISIVILIIVGIRTSVDKKNSNNMEKISKNINKNIRLASLYNAQKTIYSKNYLGKIYIDKINLEYVIFNEFSEELLKIAPCKFYGNNIGDKGNLCIAGHNYNDERFFGNLKKLKLGDEIYLDNLEGNIFKYSIFDIYETDENDMQILNSSKDYELTLLTCNNSNKKRIIIKAEM